MPPDYAEGARPTFPYPAVGDAPTFRIQRSGRQGLISGPILSPNLQLCHRARFVSAFRVPVLCLLTRKGSFGREPTLCVPTPRASPSPPTAAAAASVSTTYQLPSHASMTTHVRQYEDNNSTPAAAAFFAEHPPVTTIIQTEPRNSGSPSPPSPPAATIADVIRNLLHGRDDAVVIIDTVSRISLGLSPQAVPGLVSGLGASPHRDKPPHRSTPPTPPKFAQRSPTGANQLVPVAPSSTRSALALPHRCAFMNLQM